MKYRWMQDDDEPPGGARWLTTYADMVTLILCFFVLLFSMSIVEMDKFSSRVFITGALGIWKVLYSPALPPSNDIFEPGDLQAKLAQEMQMMSHGCRFEQAGRHGVERKVTVERRTRNSI